MTTMTKPTDWPGIGTGFVKIGIALKELGPVPIPCQCMNGEFVLNSSSEYTRDHPTQRTCS